MKKLIYLFCALSAIYSCSAERQSREDAFVIDYQKEEVFDWNSIQIDEVIPLETNDSCILSFANKCMLANNRIVYHDSKQKALFVFDSKGKFLYNIDALGNGDKEYSIIKDVTLSRNKRDILLLDNTSVLVFDLATGAYRSRTALDSQVATRFFQLADGGNGRLYFWSTNPDNSLYALNGNRLTILKKREGFPYVSQKFYNDASGGLNLLSDYGQYSIEAISGDSILPKYSFDFGSLAFPIDEIPQTATEWEKVDKQPYFKGLLSAFETEDVLYVDTATPSRELYSIVIQKSNSRILCGIQDIDAPVAIIDADATYFYGILYPSFFAADNRFADLFKEYQIAEDDNPLIIKFRFNFDSK